MRLFVSCLLGVVFLFSSCAHNSHRATHAYYYWRTTYDNNSDTAFSRSGAEKMYIHICDIDWSETSKMPVPRGSANIIGSQCQLLSKPYVPVVFITNRVFEQVTPEWCDTLANLLAGKIAADQQRLEQAYQQGLLPAAYMDAGKLRDSAENAITSARIKICTELQIDCDWTKTTCDKYFRFLRAFKALNKDKTLSVTVRMYPYKYRTDMGVPPADRVMLMCYNLGHIKSTSTRNSILDVQELAKYLDVAPYPLPVDVALPSFGWYAWFRSGKYMGIVHNVDIPLSDTSLFTAHENEFAIRTDTVIDDTYYREGDVLRNEVPPVADINKAAELVAAHVHNIGTIAFFDWNNNTLDKYGTAIHTVFAHY